MPASWLHGLLIPLCFAIKVDVVTPLFTFTVHLKPQRRRAALAVHVHMKTCVVIYCEQQPRAHCKPFRKCFQLSQTFKISVIMYQHKLLVQLDAVPELVRAGAGMSSTWPLMNAVAASNPPPSSSGPSPTAAADGCRGSAVQRWRLTDEISGCESCPTDKLRPRPCCGGGGRVQALSADRLPL